jgi:membrane-associated protease RseP (regulator of RpoE activity)
MGITFDILDAQAAAARGAPIDGGVLVTEASDGAAEAGLASGDLLEVVGETRVSSWHDLVAALRGRAALDTIPVTYWRDGLRSTSDVTLKGRTPPALQNDPELLAAQSAADAAERLTALRAAFAGASEDAAAHRPGPNEWSAKEVLSHVISSETWSRGSTFAAAFGTRPGDWSDPYDEMHRRRLQESSIADAIGATEAAIRETALLNRDLLTPHPTPPVIHRVGATLHHDREHFDEHLSQIRQAIADAG